MAANRYFDWFRQAEDDLAWCKDTIETNHPAQACFIAQQIAAKALKALAYNREIDFVKSHSVRQIARALEINSEIENAGKILDQYYITTRYPDAIAEGSPFETYTHKQAIEAYQMAEMVLKQVGDLIERP